MTGKPGVCLGAGSRHRRTAVGLIHGDRSGLFVALLSELELDLERPLAAGLQRQRHAQPPVLVRDGPGTADARRALYAVESRGARSPWRRTARDPAGPGRR